MIVFPAIDILAGRAVRLAQGDYNRVTVYNEYPVAQAREFVGRPGAEWIHVVDLDWRPRLGAGRIAIIERIARETGARLEVGGGVRTLETMGPTHEAGVERVVIGTKLVSDPEFVPAAVSCCGHGLVAGAECSRRHGCRRGLVCPNCDVSPGAYRRAARPGHLSPRLLRHLTRRQETGINAPRTVGVAVSAGFPSSRVVQIDPRGTSVRCENCRFWV